MGKKKLILGIDLGTTYSLACVQDRRGEFHYFSPKGDGQVLMPSVFLHKGNNQFVIGEEAELEEQLQRHRNDVIRHVKRYMKYNYDYGMGKPQEFKSNGKKFIPAKVSGEILRTLKEAAERDFRNAEPGSFHEEFKFRGRIDHAVITVPAYFGPQERQATRDAAAVAGFSDVELLDEPVSAAIGMRLHEKPGKRIALVIDLGGGTCDITILKVGQAVDKGGFEELGRIGDNEVGGITFDREIVQRTVFSDTPPGYTDNQLIDMVESSSQGRLYRSAERAKIYLCDSIRKKRNISAHVAWIEPTQEKQFETDVSLDWFLENTEYLIEYVGQMCDFLLSNIDRKEAGLKRAGTGMRWNEVDSVYLVGGGARMPQLQDCIAGRWKSENTITIADRPQWVVAEGAATYADMLSRNETLAGIAMPRCPYDIGVMYRPQFQPTFWERVRNKIKRTPQKTELSPLKFSALIKSNSLLDDSDNCVHRYETRVTNQNAKSVKISICQRFVGRNAEKVNGDSAPQQDDRNHRVNYQLRVLRNLLIDELPPGRDPENDRITIEIRYNADHTMQFDAWYQNRHLPPVEIRRDEFERFSELRWDASKDVIS
jgi:molecular chaperone DnaK (HSP70)